VIVAALLSGSFALAFSAGMIATVNPCGFAMLPAYLSYFLGRDDDAQLSPARNVLRALAVGLTLTAGFTLVFGVFGVIYSHFSQEFLTYTPYVTIVIGAVLAVLGIAMLRGFEPTLRIPKVARAGEGRELWSIFVFGASYAVASLGCTIGPFVVAVAPTFRENNFASGVTSFVLYGLGMGTIVVFLTIATALAKTSLLRWLRKVMPYVNRIAGVLLIVTGLYVAYYGWYEIRIQDEVRRDPIVEWFQDRQIWAQRRIDSIGAVRLGLLFVIAVVAATTSAIWWRRTNSTRRALVE